MHSLCKLNNKKIKNIKYLMENFNKNHKTPLHQGCRPVSWVEFDQFKPEIFLKSLKLLDYDEI